MWGALEQWRSANSREKECYKIKITSSQPQSVPTLMVLMLRWPYVTFFYIPCQDMYRESLYRQLYRGNRKKAFAPDSLALSISWPQQRGVMRSSQKNVFFDQLIITTLKLALWLFPNNNTIKVRAIISPSVPHIFIYFYNETNEEVSSNVDNDKGGEHYRYGNVSSHFWSLPMFIATWPNKEGYKRT